VSVRAYAAVLLVLSACASAHSYTGPTGMAALQDIDGLPKWQDGVKMHQFSSYDRGGGNYDSGNFLEKRGNEYVMMDATGPGQVCRLWLTNAGPNHHIRVYIDGDAKPRVDLTVTELFSGAIYPFVWPLVGNDTVSSGGYYSYVQIPFRKGCRVTTDCKDLYYNVQYQAFDNAGNMQSYPGYADPRAAIAAWRSIGHVSSAKSFTKTVTAPANGIAELLDFKGCGRIVSLKISVPGLGKDEQSQEIVRNLWLRIVWDDEKKAAVDAPLGPFHCAWFPDSTARGLFVGCSKPGEFYCYYPMPFAKRARIELVNKTGEPVSGIKADVAVRESAADARDLAAHSEGRFRAVYSSRTMNEGDPDYVFADLKGSGIALGVSMWMKGAPERGQGFLEGDERIYYDGSAKPQLHGTGTEDYFNGGYYFDRGLFSLPLHGYTGRRYELRDQEAMYRLYLADRIFYSNGFRAGIEHGGTNDQAGDYESVFYYYDLGPAKPRPNASAPAKAPSAKQISIAGRVTIDGGGAAAGAIVTARKPDGMVAGSALTHPDGGFELAGLPAGKYDLRVESPATVPYTLYDVTVAGTKPTAVQVTVKSSCADILKDGRFQNGFANGVAKGWDAFHTESYDGEYSQGDGTVQRIHMPEPPDGDWYVGLRQKLDVVPAQLYTFSAEAMTLFTGDEENPWDNVMAKLCFHPKGSEDFRSRDTKHFLFPAEHGSWYRLSQEVATVGDTATVYLAAWRKFPRGGSQADVEFRNASFVGPTVPPPAPKIVRSTWQGPTIELDWKPDEAANESWYAISKSRNERDIVVPWTRAAGRSALVKDARVKSGMRCFVLAKCVNSRGVESEIAVAAIK